MPNDKLSKQIRDLEEAAADVQLAEQISSYTQEQRERAFMLIGGFHATAKIAQAIDVELMRALETFQQQEIYKALGFGTMVEFLNSDKSPMTKGQYYERKALLDKEGEPLFDLYATIGLSIRRRKLLGAGSVELEGDTVIVHQDDEELAIDITDRTRLLETLTALADANALKSKKLEKLQDKAVKTEQTIRDLYQENDRIRAAKRAEVNDDPHSHAIVNLTFAYQNLISTVGDMSEIERQQFVNQDFELIAAHMQDLAAAYGRSDWTKISPQRAETSGDDIDAVLSKALDEDEAALTAAM